MMEKLKLAILDMYDNEPNQGMRAIQEIVQSFGEQLDWEVFDVRGKAELPNAVDFDLYISTGGPGAPLDGDGIWDKKYYDFIDELWAWNKADRGSKKYVFFICHSFQMACHHFQIAEITKRKSRSFGTFPTHKTSAGERELLFKNLEDPFTVADFRDWQVVQPNIDRMKSLGMKTLATEKKRPHVDLERAMMAVRFSPEFFGTQF
ncbi:MAG: GMP synthase, partial [Saprospiraceae bacterium]